MRFVSDVIFPFQLYNRYMYLRFCTNQAIHSGQNLLNWAAETIQFEINMTKESRQFPHYYIIQLSPLWSQGRWNSRGHGRGTFWPISTFPFIYYFDKTIGNSKAQVEKVEKHILITDQSFSMCLSAFKFL